MPHEVPEGVEETEREEPFTAPEDGEREAVGLREPVAVPLPRPAVGVAKLVALWEGVGLLDTVVVAVRVGVRVPVTVTVGLCVPVADTLPEFMERPCSVPEMLMVKEAVGLREGLMVALPLPAAPCRVDEMEAEGLEDPATSVSVGEREAERVAVGEALEVAVPPPPAPAAEGEGGWLGVTLSVSVPLAPSAKLGVMVVLELTEVLAERAAREAVAGAERDREAVGVTVPEGEAEGEGVTEAQDEAEALRVVETEPLMLEDCVPLGHWLPVAELPGVLLEPSCRDVVGVVEAERLPVRDTVAVLQGEPPTRLAEVLGEGEVDAVALAVPVAPRFPLAVPQPEGDTEAVTHTVAEGLAERQREEVGDTLTVAEVQALGVELAQIV